MNDEDNENDGRDESPGRHRRDDQEGSMAGADDVSYRAGTQKARLLAAYEHTYPDPLTDNEAAELAGINPLSCYWKRCNELRKVGAILQLPGQMRMGSQGTPRMLCVFIPVGQRVHLPLKSKKSKKDKE